MKAGRGGDKREQREPFAKSTADYHNSTELITIKPFACRDPPPSKSQSHNRERGVCERKRGLRQKTDRGGRAVACGPLDQVIGGKADPCS